MSTSAPHSPFEVERANRIWRALEETQRNWVQVKSGEGFKAYVYHGSHDQTAYSIYSDGRSMAFALADRIGLIAVTEECPSHTVYVNQLEEFYREKSNYYRERHAFHKKYAAQRINNGAPDTWEIDYALSLWDDQIKFLDEIPRIINLFKNSDTYKSENNMHENTPAQQININAGHGATIQSSAVAGNNNTVSNYIQTKITKGNKEELFANLKSAGISEDLVQELDSALEEDRQEGEHPTELGTSTQSWIGKVAGKIAVGAITLLNGVSTEVIAQWITSFLGIS